MAAWVRIHLTRNGKRLVGIEGDKGFDFVVPLGDAVQAGLGKIHAAYFVTLDGARSLDHTQMIKLHFAATHSMVIPASLFTLAHLSCSALDRKSVESGKRVSERLAHGGSRTMKK